MLRYILLPLLAISASAFLLERNPCKNAGFFTLVDKTPTFYGCYPNKAGGFTLKVLTCPVEQVFSAAVGHCVPGLKIKAVADADDNNDNEIESPTIPPASSTTKQPDIENPTVPTQSSAATESSTKHLNEDTTTEEPSEDTTTSEGTTTTKKPETTTTEEPNEDTTTSEEPNETTTTTKEPTESSTTTEKPTEGTTTTEKPGEETTTSEEPNETTTTEEPNETTTEEPNESTTQEPNETTEGPGPEPTNKPFNCPTEGFFPTDGDGCQNFVYCRSSTDSQPIYLTCPPGQSFNPNQFFCEESWKCEGSDPTNPQLEFDCIMEGVFPDETDHAKYIVCTWSEKANAFKYEHKLCPETEVFHKLTGRCGRRVQLPKTLLHLVH